MPLFVKKNQYRRGSMEIDDAVLTITERDADRIEWPLKRSISGIFLWGMLLVLGVLGARTLYLSVIKGAEYQEAARRNSLRQLVIPAPRGIIYDRFGVPLIYNVPSLDAVLIPADVPEDTETQTAIKHSLQSIFGIESLVLDEVFSKLNRRTVTPVLLKERISQEEALVFLGQSRDLSGVSLYKTKHRNYVDSVIFSHALGYEGKIRKEELKEHPEYLMTDSIGKQGIEKSYESILRGTHGFQRVEVDAFGKVIKDLGTVEPESGSDLITTLDAGLQKKLFDSLQTLLEKRELRQAAALAIDPRNGAVRALVSLRYRRLLRLG